MAWYRHVFTKIVIVAVASIALPCFIGSAHAVDYTMSITTSGSRSVNVAPRADGVGTSISADNINVQTTCRAGYNLTISTSVNNNNLYLDGDIANNTSGTYFTPASGSSTLKNSPNTWGYLVSDTTPNENSTFSPVPALGTTATIKTPVSSTADIDDHFNVYYGVSVANAMNTGTYKMIPDTSVTPNKDGAIVYYLTMADACTSYTVQFSPAGADNNGTIRTGSGTMANQTIKENIATSLTANAFTAPSGYYFAGWNTAQDGSGTSYADGESVTNLAAVGQTITLYAQWTDCQGGYVCYNSNGATGPIVSGNVAAIANQSVSGTATAVTLQAQNFYRTNYGFLGWSTIQLDPDDTNFASNFANATAAGKVYGPNETLTITAGQYSSEGLRLYAVWLPKSTSYTMQTFGATQCASELTKIVYAQDAASNSGVSFSTENQSSITLDSFIALQDARDTNVYTVARLTDGNCWMLENLRLDNTNTDNSTGALAQGYHSDSTYGNFMGLADPETANFINSTTANSLYYSGTQSGTATVDIRATNYNYPGYRMPRYNKNNTGSTVASSTGSVNTYGYGNYYTWAAAMANITYYGTATETDADGKTSETVNTSICPKGWSLPYGRSSGNGVTSGGFSYLSTSMGGSNGDMSTSSTPTGAVMSNRLRQFPNNFIYSGRWLDSSAGGRGNTGYYWSRSASTNTKAYVIYLGSPFVYPGTNHFDKYYGVSVRCLSQ